MSIEITDKGDGRYLLAGNLNFATAKDALGRVLAKLDLQEHTVLDLQGISHANSAGLALMVEWRSAALQSQKKVSFENIPNSLSKIAIICQVDELLQ